MIKIFCCISGGGGVPFYRTKTPHVFLQDNFPKDVHVDIIEKKDFTGLTQLDEYDIYFFHRHVDIATASNDTILDYCKSKGIKTIMDIDDSYEVPNSHPAYGAFKSTNLKQKIISNFKKVDLVTTTTPYFKKEIKKYRGDKPIRILPNAIDPSWQMFQPREKYTDRKVVSWIGGSSHKEDVKLLRSYTQQICRNEDTTFMFGGFDTRGKKTILNPQIQKMLAENDGRINAQILQQIPKEDRFKQIDMLPHETVYVFYEKLFTDDYKLISSDYKNFLEKYEWQTQYEKESDEKYRRMWTKDINKYADIYNDTDISLAPLVDNHFNRCKSQLKVIESGFFKVPIIAQNIAPYQIDIEHGVNGFLIDTKKNHKDWVKYTNILLRDDKLRKEMGENLYNTVKDKYTLEKVSKKRLIVYKKLVKNILK